MAKQSLNISFKNAEISLADNAIYEYGTKKEEEMKTYVLSDVLRKFEGEKKRVNITLIETSELESELADHSEE